MPFGIALDAHHDFLPGDHLIGRPGVHALVPVRIVDRLHAQAVLEVLDVVDLAIAVVSRRTSTSES